MKREPFHVMVRQFFRQLKSGLTNCIKISRQQTVATLIICFFIMKVSPPFLVSNRLKQKQNNIIGNGL